jgi:hypothetical protein
MEEFKWEEEWQKYLFEFKALIKKEERDRLAQEIKNKEKDGAFNEVKELLLKFNKLIKNNEENKKEAGEESCQAQGEESSEEEAREEGDKEG